MGNLERPTPCCGRLHECKHFPLRAASWQNDHQCYITLHHMSVSRRSYPKRLSINAFHPMLLLPQRRQNKKMQRFKTFRFCLLICPRRCYGETKPLIRSIRRNLCDFPKLICCASSMSTSGAVKYSHSLPNPTASFKSSKGKNRGLNPSLFVIGISDS